jgi:hypothetical protein
MKTLENIIHMEKIPDIKPTAELSPEMIKTICDAISQEFSRWELKDEDDEAGWTDRRNLLYMKR